MKKLLSGLILSSVVVAAFAILEMSQRSTASAIISSNTIQQGPPLTLDQVESMIKLPMPDGAIAREINRRRLAFKLNANLLARVKSLNAGPGTIQALEAFLPKRPIQREARQPSDPNRFTILVADFDGLEPKRYRVTEHIISRLQAATSEYSDISVQGLGKPITPQEGSEVARAIGIKRNASIILSGWYSGTEMAYIGVNFKVLREPKLLSISEKPEAEGVPIDQLNKGMIQSRLSKEIAYLTLLTAGMLHYEKGDYDGAIKRFTTALAQLDAPNQISYLAELYYYRGSAYYNKGGAKDIDQAIDDYNKAIAYKSAYAEAYYNRGNAYGRKGQQDLAIADFDTATSVKPDYAEAYYNRALVYMNKGERNQAILELENVLRTTNNPKLRQSAQQKLKELRVG